MDTNAFESVHEAYLTAVSADEIARAADLAEQLNKIAASRDDGGPETFRQRALAWQRLGEVRERQGRCDDAVEAFTWAVAMWRTRNQVATVTPPDTQDLWEALMRLGDALGDALADADKYADARDAFRAGREQLCALAEETGDTAVQRQALKVCLREADSLSTTPERDAARPLLDDAVARQRACNADPESQDGQDALAATLSRAGSTLVGIPGHEAAGRAYLAEAIALERGILGNPAARVVGEPSGDALDARAQMADSLFDKAHDLTMGQGPGEAVAWLREAADHARTVAEQRGREADWSRLSAVLDGLAWDLARSGQPTEAIALYQERLDVLRERVAPSESDDDGACIAFTRTSLGWALWLDDRTQEAVEHCQEALAIQRRIAATRNTYQARLHVSITLNRLADAYRVLEAHDEKWTCQNEALDIRQWLLASHGNLQARWLTANSHARVARDRQREEEVFTACEDWEIAVELYRQVVAERPTYEARRRLGRHLSDLALVLVDTEGLAPALAAVDEAVARIRDLHAVAGRAETRRDLARVLGRRADLILRRNSVAATWPVFAERLELLRFQADADPTAQNFRELALALQDTAQQLDATPIDPAWPAEIYLECEHAARRARALADTPGNTVQVGVANAGLAEALRLQGRTSDALVAYRRAYQFYVAGADAAPADAQLVNNVKCIVDRIAEFRETIHGFADKLATYEEHVAECRKRLAEDESPARQRALARALAWLAPLEAETGPAERAESTWREAIALGDSLASATQSFNDLATLGELHDELGRHLGLVQGRLEAAHWHCEAAVHRLRAAFAESQDIEDCRRLAAAQRNALYFGLQIGPSPDESAIVDESISTHRVLVSRDLLIENKVNLATNLKVAAEWLDHINETDKAITYLVESIDLQHALIGGVLIFENSRKHCRRLGVAAAHHLGNILENRGDIESAYARFLEAGEFARKRAHQTGNPDDHHACTYMLQRASDCARNLGDIERAHALCADAADQLRPFATPQAKSAIRVAMIQSERRLADIAVTRNDPSTAATLAEAVFTRAQTVYDECVDPPSVGCLAACHLLLGDARMAQGLPEAARDIFRRGWDLAVAYTETPDRERLINALIRRSRDAMRAARHARRDARRRLWPF